MYYYPPADAFEFMVVDILLTILLSSQRMSQKKLSALPTSTYLHCKNISKPRLSQGISGAHH